VTTNTRLSPLERFLSTFTDIRPGEGITGLVMFANVFVILCAYYFVKPLRDAWIAVSHVEGLSGMELKAYSSFLQSLLLAGIASGFARLSGRVDKRKLVTGSTLVCISNLVLFWMAYPGVMIENLPFAGVVFYLWVGMFGVFIVAQFWTMAADMYAGESGTRLLPMIAIGATAGAAFGSLVIGRLVSSGVFSSGSFLLLATLPLALSIWLTHMADVRGPVGTGPRPASASTKATPAEVKSRGKGALSLIFRTPYLVSVAVVILLCNWVNTNGENLMFSVLQDALRAQAAGQGLTGDQLQSFIGDGTTIFYGNFFIWVNVIALIAQAFVASRLLRYGGFGAIMMLLPVVSTVAYSTMAFLPMLGIVRMFKTAENSIDYSINKTAQQVLWLPTSSETKYRAKPAIDSLFVRMGDGFAALTVLLGARMLDLSNRSLFLVNVALAVTWLVLSFAITRTYARMVKEHEREGAS